MSSSQDSLQRGPTTDVRVVLASILRHPFRMLGLRWNFKTAALSALFRGTVFLAAICRSQHAGRVEAVLLEATYGAVAAGIFGALVQSLRSAKPTWMAETVLFLVVPLLLQLLDFATHALFGTAVFRVGLFASAVLTGVSALFSLYAMRRGVLLIGKEGKTIGGDLCSLPALALGFVLAAPVNAAHFIVRVFPFPLFASGKQK